MAKRARTWQKETVLTFRTYADTVTSQVFIYLRGKVDRTLSQREGKQRGLEAMSAFWKPYALRTQKNLTPEELQAIARDSIEQLYRHANRMAQDFNVAGVMTPQVTVEGVRIIGQNVSGPTHTSFPPVMPPPITASPAVAHPIVEASPAAFDDRHRPEGIEADLDEMLGDLM